MRRRETVVRREESESEGRRMEVKFERLREVWFQRMMALELKKARWLKERHWRRWCLENSNEKER